MQLTVWGMGEGAPAWDTVLVTGIGECIRWAILTSEGTAPLDHFNIADRADLWFPSDLCP